MRDRIRDASDAARSGGPERYHDKLAEQGKLFVRDRIGLLVDAESFVEDGLLARNDDQVLAADGVVTGRARVDGRPVMVIANDPTVKAGSWGRITVEKMIRALEAAYDELLPVFYLVDSAGARITDQVELFPGRRGAGKIFYNQIRLSGRVPQICCLFGPSAAGGAYIPSFCDVVVMVEGRASMYLGSPRMARLLEEASARADVVILDSPPLLAVADSSILASLVTGTILVVQAGHTRLGACKQAAEAIGRTGGNLLGVVLNRLDIKRAGYYGGYYQYQYYGSNGNEHMAESPVGPKRPRGK